VRPVFCDEFYPTLSPELPDALKKWLADESPEMPKPAAGRSVTPLKENVACRHANTQ